MDRAECQTRDAMIRLWCEHAGLLPAAASVYLTEESFRDGQPLTGASTELDRLVMQLTGEDQALSC
jgi:hypothetical protein